MNDEAIHEQAEPVDDNDYWKRIGWWIGHYRLPIETTDDKALLEHVRKFRARERDLPEDASWFQVYVAEYRDGITPKEPLFFALMDDSYDVDGEYHHPRDALGLAQMAAEILLLPKK